MIFDIISYNYFITFLCNNEYYYHTMKLIMANIFTRINDIINANVNDLIDRLEDPERMIKQVDNDVEMELAALKVKVQKSG